jgi:hypothetical protein
MTISNTAPLDYGQPLDCDVAIVGAELAGVVAGAVLAKRGVRVVLVDEPPVIGGRGGSIEHRGYWLDGGHRAGRDVTDLMFPWQHGAEAAREAGVDVHVKPVAAGLRIHLVPAPGASDPGAMLDAAEWTPEGFAKLASAAFACPADALADFGAALERVSTSSPEEQEAALEMPLGEWLHKTVPNAAVHLPFLNMVKSMFCQFPERASAGRLMKLMDYQVASAEGDLQFTGLADDPDVGGVQGIFEPFARGLEHNGGRIILDHRPVAVEFDGDRATGVVATNPAHLVLRIRARHTVVGYPIWSVLPLLPDERVSEELRAMSRGLEDCATTGVGWVAGLKRMPKVGDTGVAETYAGWNRLLVGPSREFSGGFHFPSLGGRRSAPSGHHLISCFILNWVQRGERPSWPALDAKLQHAKAYIHGVYPDLAECIDWESDRYVDAPPAVAAGWYWAPVKRHGIRMPGCRDLFIPSSTIEGDVGTVDGAAWAGLEVARQILAER